MGNKINPIINKIIISKNWKSKWYSEKNIKNIIITDYKIRKIVKNLIKNKVEDIIIERLEIYSIIQLITDCEKIKELEIVKKEIEKITKNKCLINIIRINKKNYTINKILKTLVNVIKKRKNYKTEIKRITKKTNYKDIIGIKITLSGRINGIEIARKEQYTIGNTSLIRIENKILFKKKKINTKYGVIGIKILIILKK